MWLRSSFQLARPRMPHGNHRAVKAKGHQGGPGVEQRPRRTPTQTGVRLDKEQGTFACRLCKKRENFHTGAKENLGEATARDDSIPVRDDPSETIRFRCETIRARRSDPVRDEAIRVRYGAIRRDTRRFRCDTVRYRCETVRYGRYECDTDRFRRDTESQRPAACKTCKKRCLRGGHHY